MRGVIPSLIAALAMSLSIFGWLYLGNGLNLWIISIVGVLLGGGVYFAALWLLRVPELQYMVNGVLKRLKR